MTSAASRDVRIAVVFFGITRSLRFTLESITRNVIEPARAVASEVGVFAHFYDQDTINNPRSGEVGPLDPEEYRLLPLDRLEREPPGGCLAEYPMDALMQNGDFWRNKFRAFRNLVHQLHSLRRATQLAATFRPDIAVFARPDLWYLTPMTPWLQDLAQDPQPQVIVPDWARWEGLNDRLALVRGEQAIEAYGHRVEQMQEFCADGRMLHSEQLLQHALRGHKVRMVPLHAARVRSDGRVVREDFRPGHGRGGGGKTLAFEDFLAAQVGSPALGHYLRVAEA